MEPKKKTMLFVIVAFVLGGIGGGFVGSVYKHDRDSYRQRPSRAEIQKEFAAKLKLSPDQSAAVDSILESHRKKFEAIQGDYSSVFKAQRDSMRQEIRKLLSPEQNERYTHYVKEMEEREQKWRRQRRH
jgi:hypothetical protein